MRLRHIEVFHAVYTCGSITGAAKLLNVSQPSISKVLAHAEQQLGFHLFDRQKGKMYPTREAERLIDHVNQAYKQHQRTPPGFEKPRFCRDRCYPDRGDASPRYRPDSGCHRVLPGHHPDTMFEIETLHQHQVVRALRELRVDFGIVFIPPPTPGINIDHLATGEFVALTNEAPELHTDQSDPGRTGRYALRQPGCP